MPSAIVIGSPQAQRQPDERVWERNRGWTTVAVWIGSQAAVYGLVPALQVDFDVIDITTGDGVVYKARASVNSVADGSEEQPTNTWELLGSGLQEPITKSPAYAALSASNREELDKFIAGETPANSSPAFTNPTLSEAVAFYNLLRRDQNNYQVSQFILRHTATYSSRVVVNPTMANANKLWTTAQLPKDITPSVKNAVNNIPAQTPPEGHLFRWLFQPPTVSQALNSATVVNEEWWLYFWPTLLYPNAS